MPSATPTVVIGPRGEDRVRSGHPWIYRTDIVEAQADPGGVVLVVGARRRPLGRALYSDRSQIALRLLTRTDAPIDDRFWRERLAAAVQFRQSLALDATAYRLVHGEADLLPSLIVDRYGDCLVVQALSQGMDALLPTVVVHLIDLVSPSGVLARNDARVRTLEGLERRVDLVHGDVPPIVEVREGNVVYEADLRAGQKTGLFLDQRENRAAAATYGRGRVLDCFSYAGGFALHLAPIASEVLAIDIAEQAIEAIRRNAALNRATTIEPRLANVFDELRRLERLGERFDTIVLDPPAFAKTKAAVDKACSGYKEINLRALKLLNPGGYLVTCSCSYHVDEALFGQIVYEAAVDAGAQVTVVEKRMQARDHPVLLGVPETYYLKCFVLRRLA
jgi:23S rRNA (cytosine1962-C5)-methyltransferase